MPRNAESCSYTLFTGPAVCCLVVGNRVCTTLDTANQNCAEADSLLTLQVDSRVYTVLDTPLYIALYTTVYTVMYTVPYTILDTDAIDKCNVY